LNYLHYLPAEENISAECAEESAPRRPRNQEIEKHVARAGARTDEIPAIASTRESISVRETFERTFTVAG